MCLYNSDRFVFKSEIESNHLVCSICRNVFNTPVMTTCGHTFCKNCVKESIAGNNTKCAECRVSFTRKRTNQTNSSYLVIISSYVFSRNFIVNSMIGELIVKCDFESNGCKEVIKFESLSSHLKQCQHRVCKTCGFTIGMESDDQHNCFELMKNNRNDLQKKLETLKIKSKERKKRSKQLKIKSKEWQKKFEESDRKLIELSDKVISLETNVSDLSNELNSRQTKLEETQQKVEFLEKINYDLTEKLETDKESEINQQTLIEFKNTTIDLINDNRELMELLISREKSFKAFINILRVDENFFRRKTEYITVGNFKSEAQRIEINSIGFKVFYTRSTSSPGPKCSKGSLASIAIPFHKTQSIIYCNEPNLSAMAIKLSLNSSLKINESFFTNKSNDKNVFISSNDPIHWNIMVKMEADSDLFFYIVNTVFSDWCQRNDKMADFLCIDSQTMETIVQNMINTENQINSDDIDLNSQ